MVRKYEVEAHLVESEGILLRKEELSKTEWQVHLPIPPELHGGTDYYVRVVEASLSSESKRALRLARMGGLILHLPVDNRAHSDFPLNLLEDQNVSGYSPAYESYPSYVSYVTHTSGLAKSSKCLTEDGNSCPLRVGVVHKAARAFPRSHTYLSPWIDHVPETVCVTVAAPLRSLLEALPEVAVILKLAVVIDNKYWSEGLPSWKKEE